MKDVDIDTLQHIMKTAKQMNEVLRKSKFQCEGVNLWLADGEAAQQDVFHFHLHVWTRYKGDGFEINFDIEKKFVPLSRDRLDEIARELKSKMNKTVHNK